jgi:hypothetical protein
MKDLLIAILLIVFGGSASSQADRVAPTSNLKLTTKITQQRYCDSGYSDMAQASMSLQLTYNNTGTSPMILYKGSNLAHYVLVSLNEQNARDKKYELDQHVGWVTSGEPKLVEGSKPDAGFVVLAPNESYQTDTDISFPIALEESSQFLKPGKYVLQIIVDAWPGNTSQFEKLKGQWKSTGILCGPSVKSEPLPIQVEKEPKLVQCK